MNFFKIFLTLLFLVFSSVSYADNHGETENQAVNEIAQEIQEDEEVPLNDPFAGNEGTGGSLDASIPVEEQEDEMSLYNFKLAGIISGKDYSYISLVNSGGEVITITLGQFLGKIKLVDIEPTSLNLSLDLVKDAITEKTKAIVCVHYGGLPCDMNELIEISINFNIPIIQDSAHSEIDFEALLDTRPEVYLVFATNGMVDTNAIREKLEPVGISVIALDFYKYDLLRYEISVMADLFGKQQESNVLFSEFNTIQLEIENRLSGLDSTDRPNVVMEHHASLTRDPVVLTGTSQWTDIIEIAGGVNVFKDLPGHTTHVDMEAILDANPDILMFDGITFDLGFNDFDEKDSCTSHMDFIADRPGFDKLNAVIDDRMIIMSGEFAGPMMIHGLPTLAKYLHPEIFEDVDASSYLDDYFLTYHSVERVGKFVCVQ